MGKCYDDCKGESFKTKRVGTLKKILTVYCIKFGGYISNFNQTAKELMEDAQNEQAGERNKIHGAGLLLGEYACLLNIVFDKLKRLLGSLDVGGTTELQLEQNEKIVECKEAQRLSIQNKFKEGGVVVGGKKKGVDLRPDSLGDGDCKFIGKMLKKDKKVDKLNLGW